MSVKHDWAPTRAELGARLADWTGAQRGRFGLWLPVGFGAGIALYFALAVEPARWIGPLAVTGGLALMVARAGAVRVAGLVLVCLAAGLSMAQWSSERARAPVLERDYGPRPVEGRVVVLERRAQGPRVTLDRVFAPGLAPEDTPARVRVVLRRDDAEAVAIGQRLRVLARLRPPPPPVLPGAYDFQRRAWFDRLGAVGFALGGAQAVPGKGTHGLPERLLIGLGALRDRVGGRARAVLPDQTGAVAAALITGDRSALAPDTLAAMRDSGLAHLLAISGLHIGLVGGLVFAGLRFALALIPWVALRFPIKKWAAAGTIAATFFYMVLAGATVPTQRAFLMAAIAALAVMADRDPFSPRLVAVAALVVLALAPQELVGPSFQMSFAAVVALVAVYEAQADRLAGWARDAGPARRAGLYLLGVGLTTVIAGFATGLFALHHFGRFADYGLIANLAAVPLTAFWVMPAGIAAMLAMPFGLEAGPLHLMGLGIDAVLWVARGVASWPGAVREVPAMPVWGLAVGTLGGLWLCLWRGRARWAGLAGLAGALLSIALTAPPDAMVSPTGRLVGVVEENQGARVLWLTSTRREGFAADIWAETLGGASTQAFARADVAAPGTPRCDAQGCVAGLGTLTLAIPATPEALGEDCARADIVITPLWVGRWCAPRELLIDGARLRAQGAHALYFDDTGWRVETVRDRRGARPWTGPRMPGGVNTGASARPGGPAR